MLHVLYRMSDKGNMGEKPSFADIFFCLDNFLENFGHENLTVIADNCSEETIEKIKLRNVKIIPTNLGNAKSWRYVAEYAIKSFNDEDIVYLVEDDYFHNKNAKKLIEDVFKAIDPDYITLFDHPDMYSLNFYKSNIHISQYAHWRTSSSTTMTFATRIKTLKKDFWIWKIFTSGNLPQDYLAFSILTRASILHDIMFIPKVKRKYLLSILIKILFHIAYYKKRILLSPIPYASTTVDNRVLAPFFLFPTNSSQ